MECLRKDCDSEHHDVLIETGMMMIQGGKMLATITHILFTCKKCGKRWGGISPSKIEPNLGCWDCGEDVRELEGLLICQTCGEIRDVNPSEKEWEELDDD